MNTKCTNCGKTYPQSEAYENNYNLPALCLRCALIELMTDDDLDQEPDWFDIENAWARSGQATDEELDEIAEEHRRYPDRSSDEEEPDWCRNCNRYSCLCAEIAAYEARVAADEAQAAADEEYYNSFSVFWHDFVGGNNYNRFVAPTLIGWLRFKKRWRR